MTEKTRQCALARPKPLRGEARGSLRTWAGEAARALGVMVGFVALSLAWFALAGGAFRAGEGYSAAVDEGSVGGAGEESGAAGDPGRAPAAGGPTTWLVDGFNVLNVALLREHEREGWWREPARARLVALAARFEDRAARLWIAFDGRQPAPPDAGSPCDPVRLVFEPCADEWLVRRVREAPDPSRVAVVTADRQLAGRARHRGARVVSPHEFLALCRAPRASVPASSERRDS